MTIFTRELPEAMDSTH